MDAAFVRIWRPAVLMTTVVDGITRLSECLKLDHVLTGKTNVSLITGFRATKDSIGFLSILRGQEEQGN